MSGPSTTTRATGSGLRPATHPNSHQRTREVQAALVQLWGLLEDMPETDAAAWLNGPARAFLLGLDVPQVLDALTRDRARRSSRTGGAS